MVARRIRIGTADGREIRLSSKRRSTHLHVMGASGQGKSKFLEHCIQEDIAVGHGVCLIDPEGDLYEDIVAWCALNNVDEYKKIHLFDPTNTDWRFRFNPLHVHEGEKPRHRVDNVIEALAQVWGGEDSRSTPSIRTTIRAIFTILIERGYTLAEAFYLTSTADPYNIVQYLTAGIENPILAEIWDGYKAKAKSDRREHMSEFGGARRRFSELLSDDEIREVLATYDTPIDFRKCMDDGDIVLINLSPEAMGDDPARAFGAMFVREMFYCASRRDPKEAQEKPFYAYIDECGDFLTHDITRILARSRKRGFHVTLAHQWLEQLREQGTPIYHGVMGIQNKVIFGGISDEDAIILSDHLFRTEYDLETPINALTKPGVVGYRRTWLSNWSHAFSETESETESESTTEMEGSADGTSDGVSVSQNYDADGFPSGTYTVTTADGSSVVDSKGVASTSGYARSSGTTVSDSYGMSEALEPILEDLFGGVHSLDNVRHMAIARLRSIPERNAVVKGSATPTFDITTFPMEPINVPETMLARFKERVFSSSPYTVPAAEVRQVMQVKYKKLVDVSIQFDGVYEPDPLYSDDETEPGQKS